MNKRVLFIGYLLPDANMGGVRTRRIARLLPRHGWETVVLTHPSDAASVPWTAVTGVRVETAVAPDLTALYRRVKNLGRSQPVNSVPQRPEPKAMPIGFTSEINRWLMIPDKQMPWRRLLLLKRFRKIMKSAPNHR